MSHMLQDGEWSSWAVMMVMITEWKCAQCTTHVAYELFIFIKQSAKEQWEEKKSLKTFKIFIKQKALLLAWHRRESKDVGGRGEGG